MFTDETKTKHQYIFKLNYLNKHHYRKSSDIKKKNRSASIILEIVLKLKLKTSKVMILLSSDNQMLLTSVENVFGVVLILAIIVTYKLIKSGRINQEDGE